MSQSEPQVDKTLLENALHWFQPEFRRKLVSVIESQFPNYLLPPEIQAVLRGSEAILRHVGACGGSPVAVAQVRDNLLQPGAEYQPLFKQIILLYRRFRAAEAERLTEKTFHLGLASTVQKDVMALDALASEAWFQDIAPMRLPRLKDFMPVQYLDSADPLPFPARQYDEKFHILQAPNLFLPDLAYLRAKCEDRDSPLAVAFVNIDEFKQFNTAQTEAKVDRNLLPRFMQTIEAHVFNHGFAYRQGGDEYLIIVPGLSRKIGIAFLHELRTKLADLTYPEIQGRTTVSIGLCIVDPDNPLTDREVRARASEAKKYAKEHGRNCIACFGGSRFIGEELRIEKP